MFRDRTVAKETRRRSEILQRVDDLDASGRRLEALELLEATARRDPDEQLEQRLAGLRHAAFADLDRTPGFDTWPPALGDAASPTPVDHVATCAPSELNADRLRAAILGHGCLRVPQLAGPDDVEALTSGIERAFRAREDLASGTATDPGAWFHPLRVEPAAARTLGRKWIQGGGGLLTADSPRVLAMLLEFLSRVGLRQVIRDYLGERPVLSANKCTLRRVPVTSNTDWHQDGAFLGSGIRTVNVWLALTDCGVDAPGLDFVPRRLDGVVETGTGGAFFDWAVGPDTVTTVAGSAPVQRPNFAAGDALIFDELFLHRTAADPSMTSPRYAIESWFFAPSAYPDGQVPVVW